MCLDPLAGQPLGLRNLFACHPLLDDVFALLCRNVSLGSGQIEPHIGENVVFWDPISTALHASKEPLTFSMSLLGG